MVYLMRKPSLLKNSSGTCQPIAGGGGITKLDTFSEGISPEVNAIVRLEFELAYYDVAVPANLAQRHLDFFLCKMQ